MAEIREKIVNVVLNEAEQYLGSAMTYTLFEFVKEKQTELTSEIIEKRNCVQEDPVKCNEFNQVSTLLKVIIKLFTKLPNHFCQKVSKTKHIHKLSLSHNCNNKNSK